MVKIFGGKEFEAVDSASVPNNAIFRDNADNKLKIKNNAGITSIIASNNYFGDSSDGALAGSVTWTCGNIYQYSSVNLTSSHTITISGSGKPIVILVDGNCSINGADINLDYKGFAGGNNYTVKTGWGGHGYMDQVQSQDSYVYCEMVGPGSGGAGGRWGGAGDNWGNNGGGGASMFENGLRGSSYNGVGGAGGERHSHTKNALIACPTPLNALIASAYTLGTGGGAGSFGNAGGDGGGGITFIVNGNLSLTNMTVYMRGESVAGGSYVTVGGCGGGGTLIGAYTGTLSTTGLTITATGGVGNGNGGNGGSVFVQLTEML